MANKIKFNFTKEFLLNERKNGKSLFEIAKNTGVCYGTVYAYCLKFNIPIRKLVYRNGIYSKKSKKPCPICKEKMIRLYSNSCTSCSNKLRWSDKIYKDTTSKNISKSIKNKFLYDVSYQKAIYSSRQKEDYKNNMKNSSSFLWKDNNYVNKVKKGRKEGLQIKPNKPEKLIRTLLNKQFPNEYKFVGDGRFWIERFNPDFINCNGQKKIIEMFGDYWHRNTQQRDKERLETYSKYGYNTLIIWEKELKNIDEIRKKIIEFQKKD
jgi:very-short-patch-repair endonuclease